MNLPRITHHALYCNSRANWKHPRCSWIFGKCGYCFGRSKLMDIEVASTARSYKKISRQHSIQPLSKYFLSINIRLAEHYANFSQSANFAYLTSADFAEVQKAAAPARDVSETTANSDKPLNLLPICVSAIDHPPIDVQVI